MPVSVHGAVEVTCVAIVLVDDDDPTAFVAVTAIV
jgi:hypothetical protein